MTRLTVLTCPLAAGKGHCLECGAMVPDYCMASSERPDEISMSMKLRRDSEEPVEAPWSATPTDTTTDLPEPVTDAPKSPMRRKRRGK